MPKVFAPFFYLAGFIALTVQVVHSTPAGPYNVDAGDYDINMETFLASLLNKASLQQDKVSVDSDSDELIEAMEYDNVETEEFSDYPEEVLEQQNQQEYSNENALSFANVEKVSQKIGSGDTVAFKVCYTTTAWMTFWKSPTARISNNPNKFMDPNDFSVWKGAVFNIYGLSSKGKGEGNIRVGEQVGIYYPQDKVWLGCAAGKNSKDCYKTTCPGHPTLKYGFCDPKAISKCYGAIFKIYARGKEVGDIITHRDDIFLYIESGGQYISFEQQKLTRVAHRDTCPGSAVPPKNSKYEQCPDELFSIYKKGLY